MFLILTCKGCLLNAVALTIRQMLIKAIAANQETILSKAGTKFISLNLLKWSKHFLRVKRLYFYE